MTFQSPKSESHGMNTVSPLSNESQRTYTTIPINVFIPTPEPISFYVHCFATVSSLKKILLQDKAHRLYSLCYILELLYLGGSNKVACYSSKMGPVPRIPQQLYVESMSPGRQQPTLGAIPIISLF